MATHRSYFLSVIAASLLASVYSHDYQIYYLEDLCKDGKFQIKNDTGLNSTWILKFHEESHYTPDLTCTVQFLHPDGIGLITTVKNLNFEMGQNNCTETLVIHDVDGNKTDLSDLDSYDKVAFDPTALHLETCPQDSENSTTDFELVFTAFHQSVEGKCNNEEEFLCDTNRCVWKGLVCDSKFNCADHSDEVSCDSGKANLAGIIIGSVAAVILILILVILIIQRRRRYSSYNQP